MPEGRPATEWSRVRRLLRYVRWPTAAGAVAVSLVIGAATQSFPWLQRVAIDRYLAPRPGSAWASLPVDERVSGTARVAIAYLAIALIAFAAQYAFAALVTRTGQRAIHRLRSELFAKLHRLPVAYFDRNPVGQLVSRAVGDVESINRLLSTSLVGLAQSTFTLVAAAVFMVVLDWRLALCALAAVPVLFALLRFFGGRLRAIQARLRQREGERNAALHEQLVAMSTVQLFGLEERGKAEIDRHNRAWFDAEVSAHRLGTALLPGVVDFVTTCALAAVLWYGGGRAVQSAITLGALVAFTQYLRNFFAPLQELSTLPQVVPAALASAERVFQVLDEPETVADAAGGITPAVLRGEVEFDDVWFAYAARSGEREAGWTLKGVRFSLGAGESLAVVGATGAGKTTLLSLLARFYDAQRGEVRIDGVDVRKYALGALRRRIGLVLQDVQVLSGTIESNLRMGDESIPFARLVEVCERVGLHAYISSLRQGYQTEVSERTANLSTGQKQLLAFARALAADPQILLLDEATASVDSASEQQIQTALKELLKGRTSVIVAHRLSTVRGCDRILVMRHGEVVESGSHQSLLEQNGYYARMHALQSA